MINTDLHDYMNCYKYKYTRNQNSALLGVNVIRWEIKYLLMFLGAKHGEGKGGRILQRERHP